MVPDGFLAGRCGYCAWTDWKDGIYVDHLKKERQHCLNESQLRFGFLAL